jgi:hypothetical protein
MHDRFKPLLPASPSPEGAGAFRVKLVPGTSAVPAFKPAAPAAPSATPHVHAQPLITLKREGDRVTTIRIECTCGQVIELACQYPA